MNPATAGTGTVIVGVPEPPGVPHARRRTLQLRGQAVSVSETDLVSTDENDAMAVARRMRLLHVADGDGDCEWCRDHTNRRELHPCDYAKAALFLLGPDYRELRSVE